MLTRSMRPLTMRASSLATGPRRSSVFLGPLSFRSVASTADVTATNPAVAPGPSIADAARQLPYFVARNNLNNLSVYQKNKRGGNYKITILKYGEGDLVALKQDLIETLQLPEANVSINNVTKHIEIRGHKRDEVVNFLCNMGF